MAIGKSNRIVIDSDPKIKKGLYAVLAKKGQNLKEWFESEAQKFINKNSNNRHEK
jgi:hypothetical protein